MTGPGCCGARSTSASVARIGQRAPKVPTAPEAMALINTRRFISVNLLSTAEWIGAAKSHRLRFFYPARSHKTDDLVHEAFTRWNAPVRCPPESPPFVFHYPSR